MITDAANQLADEILKRAKDHGNMAKHYAVQYATSDKPQDKAYFQTEIMLEKKFREIHTMVCKGLHATEAEMQSRLESKGKQS